MLSITYDNVIYEPDKMTRKDINRLNLKKLQLENDLATLKHDYEKEQYHRKMIAKYNNDDILYKIPLLEARIVLDNNLTFNDYEQIRSKLDSTDIITGYNIYTGVFKVEYGNDEAHDIINPVRCNIEEMNESIIKISKEFELVLKIIHEYKKYILREDYHVQKHKELSEAIYNASIKRLLDAMTKEEADIIIKSICKIFYYGSKVYKGINETIAQYNIHKSRYGDIYLYEFKQKIYKTGQDKYIIKFMLKDSSIAFEKWFYS